ncbi:MAG: hypothetical protein GY806_05825 [Gammaproteobacteria bacterium]|nr:hypothetical protein [Gammaproteobacteria bacterium]
MNQSTASLKDARDYLVGLPDSIDEFLDEPQKRSLAELMQGFKQFFDVVATINMQASDDHIISPREATDIGSHGFGLILNLVDLLDRLDLPHRRREVEQISLILARWILRYGGHIKHLEPIVNACAQLANILRDKSALINLYNLMTDIIDSCSSDIKQDLDISNQMRPWRLLHINRSIVATRSHNPEIMKTAFNELLVYLPNEANGFFAEGMKEMVALDYPSHVRQVMEFYYQQKPTISVH